MSMMPLPLVLPPLPPTGWNSFPQKPALFLAKKSCFATNRVTYYFINFLSESMPYFEEEKLDLFEGEETSDDELTEGEEKDEEEEEEEEEAEEETL